MNFVFLVYSNGHNTISLGEYQKTKAILSHNYTIIHRILCCCDIYYENIEMFALCM